MDLDDELDEASEPDVTYPADEVREPDDMAVSAWLWRTGYHPPSSDAVIAAHEKARATIGTAGRHLLEVVPDSDERDRMLDALDSALMWANAAIARRHLDNCS